jgi:CubicO group peptidase (beta-lactamase class C family)
MKENLLKLFVLSFLVISFTSCHSQKKIKNLVGYEVSTDSITALLKSRMDSLNISGLSIAIINDGKVAYHQTLGYADLEKKLPVTDKTIFEGASMSKSVFAFFVMKFVEDGKLNLDKPLYQYLPYEDIVHDYRYRKITARMVLSHRTGFPNWRENEEDKKLKIKFEPGTAYGYSGEGYQYLAMVLKHIEGTDWNGLENKFQETIAKPIGLEHTVFIQTPYTKKNKAEPYDKNGNWIDWKNNYWHKKDKGKFVAPASMHSEPLDFSKWMIAVMNKRVLSENSYKEMLKHHSLLPSSSPDLNIYYTLGYITADEPYQNTFLHDGSTEGFTCWYLMDIKKKWGYVLFTNSENAGSLGNDLWSYFEKDYE